MYIIYYTYERERKKRAQQQGEMRKIFEICFEKKIKIREIKKNNLTSDNHEFFLTRIMT